MKQIAGDIVKEFDKRQNVVMVHQVNCRGVMGSGLAKQIRDTHPRHYDDYKAFCVNGSDHLGDFFVTPLMGGKLIAGLFGQDNYGTKERQTNYAALSMALFSLVFDLQVCFEEIPEILIPFGLGCGLAGGDWNMVFSLLSDIEKMLGVEFTLVRRE